MHVEHRVCDLCPHAAPNHLAEEEGFSVISVQGNLHNLFKPFCAAGSSTLDLCPHCFNSFIAWVQGRKAPATQAPDPEHVAATAVGELPANTEPTR